MGLGQRGMNAGNDSSRADRSPRDTLGKVAKVGWILCFAGAATWLYGRNATGSPSLIDWYSAAPWWFAGLFPNIESEMGTATLTIGALLIYSPARR